jgi:hypothetical protein
MPLLRSSLLAIGFLAAFVATTLGAPPKVYLSFSGGNGSPLQVTVSQPISYVVQSSGSDAVFFNFIGTNVTFGGMAPNGPSTTLRWTKNGGSPQTFDEVASAFTGGDLTAGDLWFGAMGGARAVNDVFVISPGTLTSLGNVAAVRPPDGYYTTFLDDGPGNRTSSYGVHSRSSGEVAYVKFSDPWSAFGHPLDMKAALNTNFGVSGYTEMPYSSISSFSSLSSFRVIVLEGSAANGSHLLSFLNTHRSALEDWVYNGGRLLMTFGVTGVANGDYNLGFGISGTVSTPFPGSYSAHGQIVSATLATSPEVAPTILSSGYFAHTYFLTSGPSASFETLARGYRTYSSGVLSNLQGAILIAGSYGAGQVVVSGVTLPDGWTIRSGSGRTRSLLNNIVAYETIFSGSATTLTQGQWDYAPKNSVTGAIESRGVNIGNPIYKLRIGSSSLYYDFHSAMDVRNYLPSSGTPRVPAGSQTNPLRNKTTDNTFAAQLISLTLNIRANVGFAKGLIDVGHASLTDAQKSYLQANTLVTVRDLLDRGNAIFGGTIVPAKGEPGMITSLLDLVNKSFPAGVGTNLVE